MIPPHFMAGFRRSTALLPLLCAILLVCIRERAPASTPPTRLDVSSFPAAMVEDVVVPVPGEIFAVLDKLGTPDWRTELRSFAAGNLQDRPQIALLLGTVIANGFIAVQAQDAEQVKEIGREVLRLAGAVGVRDSVVRRSKSIIDAAEARDWPLVRRELDKALQDVRNAMIELNDEQLAQLVSLGGWLRGTEALTSIVSKDFSADGAELLHQPGLFDYFQNRLVEMPEPLRTNALVHSIEARLGEMRPLIDVGDGRRISEDSVLKLFNMTNGLVSAITAADPSAAPPEPGRDTPAPAN